MGLGFELARPVGVRGELYWTCVGNKPSLDLIIS